MYLGHGAYGVEAASRLYFDKSNKQLTLEEAALIGGIFQSPERQSPFVDMKRAVSRRNIVLQRMADERYITQAQADEARRKPIVTRGQPNQPPGIAPFFVEEVRKHLERQYGAKVLYESGLAVTTTLDSRLQDLANKTIEHGLRAYDKRHGWRKPARNVLAARPHDRDVQGRPLEPPDCAGRRRAGHRRDGAQNGRGPCAVRTLPRRPAARGLRLDAQDLGRGPLQARRSHRGRGHQDRRRDRRGRGHARPDAARRGGAARHRQPHRADQGDGRRLELRPQQVQPGRAGVPPAGVDLQADRVHGGDRPRLHAEFDSHGRARSATRRATGRRGPRRTTITSSSAPSRCGMRSRNRAISPRSR